MTGTVGAPADFPEWQRRYLALHSAAERLATARRRRASQMCVRAGLGELAALHNALVGERRGTPWRGVDYALVRQADAVAAGAREGFAVLKRWSERYPLRALARGAAPGDRATTPLTKGTHEREPINRHGEHRAPNSQRR